MLQGKRLALNPSERCFKPGARLGGGERFAPGPPEKCLKPRARLKTWKKYLSFCGVESNGSMTPLAQGFAPDLKARALQDSVKGRNLKDSTVSALPARGGGEGLWH